MRFAIRDDDTNFFTTSTEINRCYSDIWQDYPPTLCLISKVKGNWTKWVHQIYQDKHNTDWDAWTADDTIYPIEDNAELIAFIKNNLSKNRLDIGYHAKHHRNQDSILPAAMNNNYVRGAEYYTSRNVTEEINTELNHLNNLFNYKISVFTPPQNLLSLNGYHCVINAGLNICGGGISFYKKEKDILGISNILKQSIFKVLHKGVDYARVIKYTHHNEIPYHYPLQPGTQLNSLIDSFNKVRSIDGDFVLSTHYVEFNYPMTYDPRITMKDVLLRFLDYVSKYNNVEKMSLSKLLSGNKKN
jgi:hypothetical protein